MLEYIENEKDFSWDIIYRNSFEGKDIKDWIIAKDKQQDELSYEGDKSICLTSDLNTRKVQLVQSLTTPFINIQSGDVLKAEVRVYAPEVLSPRRRGAVIGIVGYDDNSNRLWNPWVYENSIDIAESWRMLSFVKKIKNDKVDKIKLRLGISGGMGKVYFDDLKLLKLKQY